ncbi:MAG: metalloregulator ArsR/SmtB family transcription factor [Candidatus Andersenbacteria bacterium]|nr:metalloregulator ArsR/SmtB family transcription factor [bacterium]MDZ4225486.1 metalloregulator ArsR/SmtB family transcription factor [Candidatus Andersenbacteria bacterium]
MYQEIFKLHAELLKALANPRRLEIVNMLREREMSVGDMQLMLHLPQANLSQHLEVLRAASVVAARREGKQVFYKVANKNFTRASDLMREVLIERYKDNPLADEFTRKMSDLVPLVADPVCGMRLSPKIAGFAHRHKGKEYFFCASGCWEKFKKSPLKFIHKQERVYER